MKKAVDILEESSYTDAQLNGYDKFWDIVRTERTYINAAIRKGMSEGRAEGFEQGRAQGRAEGEKSALYKVVERMRAMGLNDSQIAEATGMDLRQIEELRD